MLKLHSYSICSVPGGRLLIAFCLVLIFLNRVWSYCDWYRAHCIDWLYKLSCYLFRKHNRRSQELCVSSPMMTSICTSAALVYSLSLQTTMGQTSSCSRIQTLAYRKVASSNTSRLEAQAGFFRLLMKGIFNPYVLWPFDKKSIF